MRLQSGLNTIYEDWFGKKEDRVFNLETSTWRDIYEIVITLIEASSKEINDLLHNVSWMRRESWRCIRKKKSRITLNLKATSKLCDLNTRYRKVDYSFDWSWGAQSHRYLPFDLAWNRQHRYPEQATHLLPSRRTRCRQRHSGRKPCEGLRFQASLHRRSSQRRKTERRRTRWNYWSVHQRR